MYIWTQKYDAAGETLTGINRNTQDDTKRD